MGTVSPGIGRGSANRGTDGESVDRPIEWAVSTDKQCERERGGAGRGVERGEGNGEAGRRGRLKK